MRGRSSAEVWVRLAGVGLPYRSTPLADDLKISGGLKHLIVQKKKRPEYPRGQHIHTWLILKRGICCVAGPNSLTAAV